MATLLINGAVLHYDELGSGQPVVLTPGGRLARDAVRPLAELLSQDHRVIIYDRRNCGSSDVVISGDKSEQDIWVDDLHKLLAQLDATPAYVGGGSAGCRVSLMLAIRYPADVKGLLLWWVTGGAVAAERLGHQYYGEFIEAAAAGGMEAVIATPFFSERIQQNPSNKDRLLSMDPANFIEVMARWRSFFTADSPVIGATEDELRGITAPAIIISGDDDIHLRAAADTLDHLLPRSNLHPPLWSSAEVEAMRQNPTPETRRSQGEKYAAIFGPFLAELEQTAGVAGG